MDEFGLDEERFFALSSPEDGGDAAGASPGGRAERAMPGCNGPERDAPWDAVDILVPHRPTPDAELPAALRIPYVAQCVCISKRRSLAPLIGARICASSMRLFERLFKAFAPVSTCFCSDKT